jgi:hypothetical protein
MIIILDVFGAWNVLAMKTALSRAREEPRDARRRCGGFCVTASSSVKTVGRFVMRDY